MKKFLIFILILTSFINISFAQNILFIGDSHSVGPFGKKLDSLLRENKFNIETYASCGSVSQWWFTGKPTKCGYFFRNFEGEIDSGLQKETPLINKLIEKDKPSIVIVELGANYVNTSDEFALEDMTNMAKLIKEKGVQCFWITTPDSRKNSSDIPRIISLTQKAVSSYCKVFDSTKVTKYPKEGGDGIHYSFKEGIPIAEKWAEEVFKWMELKKFDKNIDD